MSGYDKSEPKASIINLYIFLVIVGLLLTVLICWFSYKSFLTNETINKYTDTLSMERLELKSYEQAYLNSWSKTKKNGKIQIPKEKAKELVLKQYSTKK